MREKEMKECVCAEPCEGMLEDMPVTSILSSVNIKMGPTLTNSRSNQITDKERADLSVFNTEPLFKIFQT